MRISDWSSDVCSSDLISLRDILDLDDLAAQALRHLDNDLRLAGDAFFLRLDELVKAFDTRLRFGLARLGRLPDPFQFVLDRFLATRVFARFLFEALALFLQIGGVIDFIDEIAAAIEFENPVYDIEIGKASVREKGG